MNEPKKSILLIFKNGKYFEKLIIKVDGFMDYAIMTCFLQDTLLVVPWHWEHMVIYILWTQCCVYLASNCCN